MLDLPQLYQKPTGQTLLATLADLSLQPPSWDSATVSQRKRKIRSEGVPSYLTKIVSSPLAWIGSDDERERIWEAASQRLSERSGRTAMGAMERIFNIPLNTIKATQADDYTGGVAIRLHEPALTGDNLGLKTWASSYLLAKRLATLREDVLSKLAADEQILELGSGTGLVGLAAALVFNRPAILTDLSEIVPNLEHNISLNATLLTDHQCDVKARVLDWSDPSSLSPHTQRQQQHPPRTQTQTRSFPLILAADPIYSPSHPTLFTQAVDTHLSRHKGALLVVELPLRKAYAPERRELVERLEALGLGLVGEGEEVGFDDWSAGGDGEELDEVRCWWSVWGWDEEGER